MHIQATLSCKYLCFYSLGSTRFVEERDFGIRDGQSWVIGGSNSPTAVFGYLSKLFFFVDHVYENSHFLLDFLDVIHHVIVYADKEIGIQEVLTIREARRWSELCGFNRLRSVEISGSHCWLLVALLTCFPPIPVFKVTSDGGSKANGTQQIDPGDQSGPNDPFDPPSNFIMDAGIQRRYF